jgi:uncharacterized protein (TIGR02145 family)
VALAAQNGVTVSGLAINAGTVTFNVSWDRDNIPVALWSDTVWVFVDYNNAGRMERLPLRPGATLTATSAPGVGKVVEETGNNKGVWVVGNARTSGSFSATVQLLTSVNDVGGACVYGSNYPPVGEYISDTEISFIGTAPYEVVLLGNGGGTITQTVHSPYIPACDYTVESFTDKTGAPGIIKKDYHCTAPGSTVTFTAFNPCEGAAIGTTWTLQDTRDNKTYKVAMMADGRIWMAQNLNYAEGLTANASSDVANGKTFTSTTNGAPAIGSYWCPNVTGKPSGASSLCGVYGALYTWETAMMVDGRCADEAKSSCGANVWTESWVSSNTYTSGAPNVTANADKNNARGNVTANGGGRGICHPGWHVPTELEWALLLDKLDGAGTGTAISSSTAVNGWLGTDAGQKLKSAATYSGTDPLVGSWLNYNATTNGTNSSGFGAVPAGFRTNGGSQFVYQGAYAIFWSSSVGNAAVAWYREFAYSSAAANHRLDTRSYGFSVRCVRDY